MTKIELNGKTFVKHNRKGIYPNEVDGSFKKRKRGIMFYDKDNSPKAFLVANTYGERFFVSATIQNGKVWYNYAMTDHSAQFLGFDDGITTQSELKDRLARELWNSFTQNNQQTELTV